MLVTFQVHKKHDKESPNLARCGLIIPPRKNILSTGSTRLENSRRCQDEDAYNPRRDQDRTSALLARPRSRLEMELSRDVSRRDLYLEDQITDFFNTKSK